MPIKINELVIQVKVYEENTDVENDNHTLPLTQPPLTEDFLHLLEDQETR